MTIAACFLTPGGVVLGADSTQTINVSDHSGRPTPHYYEHAQKVFEIGEGSTLGAVTWGLGGFVDLSYRRLFADLSDELVATPPADVADVAARFSAMLWPLYSVRIKPTRDRIDHLEAQQSRTAEEQAELLALINNSIAGFCVAGRAGASRDVRAFQLMFEAKHDQAPAATELQGDRQHFWGAPLLINRLVYGADERFLMAVQQSNQWSGTPQDLKDLIEPFVLRHAGGFLPLREAIDYVHSCITLTCKGIKFSHLPPFCGGAAEIATITTDRRFRWVKHKSLGEALL